MTLFDFLSSNKNYGKQVLIVIVKKLENELQLRSFAKTIYKFYVAIKKKREKKEHFQLIGKQANQILQEYHWLIISSLLLFEKKLKKGFTSFCLDSPFFVKKVYYELGSFNFFFLFILLLKNKNSKQKNKNWTKSFKLSVWWSNK